MTIYVHCKKCDRLERAYSADLYAEKFTLDDEWIVTICDECAA